MNFEEFGFDGFDIFDEKNRYSVSKNFVINRRDIIIININKIYINIYKKYKNLFSTIANHLCKRFRTKNFKRHVVFKKKIENFFFKFRINKFLI